MNNLFVKMVGTFCSSSYMYLGWVLKNLCSSGTLACKSLNLHIIPFILFASLVGCSSSDSGSNLLPSNSLTPSLPPEFAIEIEGINPDEGIYYSKNSSPAFKFSNVRDGASVSLHKIEECAGESVSSDSIPADGQVSVGLKNSITADGEYTYYAKHANGAEVFDCLEIKYHLDTLAPAEPTIGLAQGTLSPSNNTTPSFVLSGVEDGALVSLHTDDQCAEANIESGTATGDSITLTLQTALSSDGIYNYYAKQVDRVGNISGCSSEGLDYELDTSALTPTIGLAQGTVSPSNNTTPSFVLSDVEDGALVSLHTDDQCMEANKVTSGTASSDSITLTLQTALSADGTYTYFAKQVDGIGNISSCSSEGFDYKLNTNVLLPITSLAQGTVNPSSNTTPGFMVSNIKNGALVSLHTDDQCAEASKVESGTATGDSITLTLQTALSSDGTYTYYAKQVDGGSNISPCSNGISYTLDTIALIPTLSLVTSSLSNNPTPTFNLGNLETGGSVGLYSDDSCSTLAQDLIEITEESMEITLSTSLISSGTYSYFAKQVDRAGNISGCSSAGVDYELDSTAPSAPTIGLAQGISSPSNNTTPSFVVSDVEDGALVSLHTDNQCAEANKIRSGTATGNSIVLILQTALSIDGTYTYYAKQIDRAGNISGCSSASVDYELDSTAPGAPTIGLAQGINSLSSNTTPSFVASDVEDGALVSLHTDDQCAEANKVTSGTATGDSITLTLQTALSIDGTYTYYAKQVDRAGNISGCSSAGVDYELDSTAPGAPTIGLAQGINSLSSNTTPSFVVSDVEDGDLVSLHTDAQCTEANKVTSGTASGDSITLTLQTALSSDGTYTYFAKQVDRAGNISGCSSAGVDYELDTNALPPTIGLAQGISSPSSNTTPSFVASDVEDGALVSLHTDDQCAEANKVTSGTATGDSITLTLQTALSIDGTYTYYAKQVDKVSNTSPCSNGIRYTLDTMVVAPTLSLVTSSSFDNHIPIFSLRNLEIGGSVGLYSDNSCSTLAQDLIEITEESMEIDLHRPLFNYGIYTYSARQTDSSGNVSDCSSAISYEFFAPFESVWAVGQSGYGDGDRSVTLPLRESDGDGNNFDYDFIVDWGDDSDEQAVTVYSDDVTHTYADAGDYTIKIKGILPTWYFNNGGDKNKIIEVKNLGEVGWKNLDSAFEGCRKLTEFTTGTTDTSQVTNMYAMFDYASGLESLDLSNWDTSNVIDMGYMFYTTSSLRSLNLSGWDTSNVIDMGYMFYTTSSLRSLNLSGWDTSSVIDMHNMFAYASELTTLNLSGWDTSSVIDMHNMFSFSSNLSSLDLSHFVTSNVIYMHNMFAYASKLTTLNLSGWDVSNVTNMSAMFNAISSLTSLDLSHFVTSNVIYMHNMFAYASKLTTLNLSGWDTSNVIDMHNMFDHASKLTTLNLSGWDTSSVIDMHNMFDYASGLESLDLSHFNTSSVIDMHNMFDYASGLESLDLSNWDTSNVTNMQSMFAYASGLESLDLSNWDTSNVTNMLSMFSNTSSLVSLNLSDWDISALKFSYSIFYYTHADLALTCSDGLTDFLGKDCQ